jgi:hypothetical protein
VNEPSTWTLPLSLLTAKPPFVIGEEKLFGGLISKAVRLQAGTAITILKSVIAVPLFETVIVSTSSPL